MKKLLLKIVLLASFTSNVVGKFEGQEVSIEIDYENNIYPSVIMTAMNFKREHSRLIGLDPNNFIGSVNSPITIRISDTARLNTNSVRIVVDESIINNRTEKTYRISDKKSFFIKPDLNYKYSIFTQLKQLQFIDLTISVFDNNELLQRKRIRSHLHSINACPYWMNQVGKMHWTWLGFVNENHPILDTILLEGKKRRFKKEARDYKGYQGTEQDVYEQVFNIWLALARKGVSYSSINTSIPLQAKSVKVQHVRFPNESYLNEQANCVDGSVLIASLLTKIDIKSVLVHVPGHMYLCFTTNLETNNFNCLETTLISQSRLLTQGKKGFDAAIKAGNARYIEDYKYIKAGYQDYALIDIAKLRNELQIVPIPMD